MKYSLTWLFEHLDARLSDYKVDDLVFMTTLKTVAIEYCTKQVLPLDTMSLAQVTGVRGAKVTLYSQEWNKELVLDFRPDAVPGALFLVTKDAYVTCKMIGSDKEGYMPSLYVVPEQLDGSWKERVVAEDYLLDVDNVSITHRPDLWGQYGMARELSAILGVPLKQLPRAQLACKRYESVAPATKAHTFSVELATPACSHFAGLHLCSVEVSSSLPELAFRLLSVGTRPINAIVDATNYVMLELGQPIHAFDASKITTKRIVPRMANAEQKLQLLDGDTVELTPDDLVISDGRTPLALAGIMGGVQSGVTVDTTELFVEAACFDARTIRKTSSRLKKRTEASMRFEKSLSPYLGEVALQRFIMLLHRGPIVIQNTETMVSVGQLPVLEPIEVSQSLITARIGVAIRSDEIVAILSALGFEVHESGEGVKRVFAVIPPFERAVKDITMAEDIVEEVVRLYGYERVEHVLPVLPMRPLVSNAVSVTRKIKQQCAFGMAMREVSTYTLYDEDLLRRLQWYPEHAVSIQNPISDAAKVLVTSLVPHLLKACEQNTLQAEELRFFEWGRVWDLVPQTNCVRESKSLTGIIYARKKEIDFYTCKQQLTTLFETLALNVSWQRAGAVAPWYNVHQVAQLMHGTQCIGYAGKVEQQFLHRIAEGIAWAFEIDGDALLAYQESIKQFVPLTKYPVVRLDISMLVPVQRTVAELIACIETADRRITKVELIDFYQKAEWKDQRSITCRFYVSDAHKTLEKKEIDEVMQMVQHAVTQKGVQIR